MGKYKIICLDAGHGGKDPGAVSGKVEEEDIVLNFVERLGHYLREQGIKTIFTRSDDTYIPINTRPAIARKTDADLLLSFHCNSAANADAQGAEAWISAAGSYQAQSNAIARKIMDALSVCGFKKRGINVDSKNRHGRLGVLRGFDDSGPAVLVEIGFISNEHDRLLLTDKESLEVIARAVAKAVTS